MKDRLNVTPIKGNSFTAGNGGHESRNSGGVNKKLCFAYNRGHCKFGPKCKFNHRCGFCGKFRHGTFNCRKANQGTSMMTTTAAASKEDQSARGHNAANVNNNK